MQAIRENAKYKNSETVWAGKYKNSQNLSHWHYDCELLYVIEGKLEVMCDKKWYFISKGDTFFINSEQVHFMHARTEDTIIIVINFDYGIIQPFTHNLTLFTPTLSRSYDIPEVYEKLKKELGNKQSFYENKTAYIIAQTMIDIFREEKIVPKTKEKPVTEQFKRLLEDINENYEFYTFETAANFMHMAPTYFSR
ncbi:MAG: AraC family ligand binding domain-containing protein, partial [Clostridia bacterium]|nr:AraC family ligand binding domain-containing protein [Clostridia bacterium]